MLCFAGWSSQASPTIQKYPYVPRYCSSLHLTTNEQTPQVIACKGEKASRLLQNYAQWILTVDAAWRVAIFCFLGDKR